jgi:hypothetical protein
MNTTHKPTAVITPFRALWHWLMSEPWQHQSAPYSDHDADCINLKNETNRQHDAIMPASSCSSLSALRKPVRVLQVLDAGQTSHHVGRLRISGRMADVCAELDRLAARELLIH